MAKLRSLSPTALKTLVRLRSLAVDQAVKGVTQDDLAAYVGCHPMQIHKSVAFLEDAGYLRIVRERRGVTYVLLGRTAA